MKVATFNCEWRKPGSPDANIIRERLFENEPDIVCLTEAHSGVFNGCGYTIEAEPFTIGNPHGTRRKVILWSREPWSNPDRIGSPNLPPERFVSGSTQTPSGNLQIFGVCIPYDQAGVRFGVPKRQRWELHLAYLEALAKVLPERPSRTLVVGDFNQRVPRGSQPRRIYTALEQALLARLAMATAGPIEPLGLNAIDHICHSADLAVQERATISNERLGGGRISDHFGIRATLTSVGSGAQ